jgi:hypothetical protein
MSIHLKKNSAACMVRGNLSVLAFGIWLLEVMFVSYNYTVSVISEFVWKSFHIVRNDGNENRYSRTRGAILKFFNNSVQEISFVICQISPKV